MLKGKIVLVPFPFDDLSSAKLRPAVCLTNKISQFQHVVLAFITSKTHDPIMGSDVLLNTDQPGFSETGLKTSSAIRLHRVITITTSIIQRELGNLTPELQMQVDEKLRKLFQL